MESDNFGANHINEAKDMYDNVVTEVKAMESVINNLPNSYN